MYISTLFFFFLMYFLIGYYWLVYFNQWRLQFRQCCAPLQMEGRLLKKERFMKMKDK